jgi:hypothetical protein
MGISLTIALAIPLVVLISTTTSGWFYFPLYPTDEILFSTMGFKCDFIFHYGAFHFVFHYGYFSAMFYTMGLPAMFYTMGSGRPSPFVPFAGSAWHGNLATYKGQGWHF